MDSIPTADDQGAFAAVRAAVNLATIWAVHPEDGSALVGVDRALWDAWEAGDVVAPSDQQLARIGHLLAIYADLHALHGPELADAWVRRPNSNPLFGGRTPLATMIAGGLPAIIAVRELLDQRRYT